MSSRNRIQTLPVELWEFVIHYILFDPDLFDVYRPAHLFEAFSAARAKRIRTLERQRLALMAVCSSWRRYASRSLRFFTYSEEMGPHAIRPKLFHSSRPEHIRCIESVRPDTLQEFLSHTHHVARVRQLRVTRVSDAERLVMLQMASAFRHLQSLTIRSTSKSPRTLAPSLEDIQMLFPQLVALSIDLTHGNCSSVWSMDHLEVLEISLLEQGTPPQPTWKLPALHSLGVTTDFPRDIEGFESFFDVYGPHIHSLAVSTSSRLGNSEIPDTWWQYLPQLDTLHLGYNVHVVPSNPPHSIRHVYLHCSFPARACQLIFPGWINNHHFNGRLTAHITKNLSSVLLLDRADDIPPRPPLPGEDRRVYGDDNDLLGWCRRLGPAGIRLEGPDGFSCGEVLSQSTARDFWTARERWAYGSLWAVLIDHSVIPKDL